MCRVTAYTNKDSSSAELPVLRDVSVTLVAFLYCKILFKSTLFLQGVSVKFCVCEYWGGEGSRVGLGLVKKSYNAQTCKQ